jgi:hypothetical protein
MADRTWRPDEQQHDVGSLFREARVFVGLALAMPPKQDRSRRAGAPLLRQRFQLTRVQ